MEKSIQESHQANVMKNVPKAGDYPVQTGYWELAQDGTVLTWSPEVFQILGIDPQQVPHWDLLISSVIHSERSAFSENLRKSLDTCGYFQYRIPCQSLKGEIKSIQIEGTVVRLDPKSPLKICGFIKDYSEERKFDSITQNLVQILDSLSDNIWVIDENYILHYANSAFFKSFEEIFGIRINQGDPILNPHLITEKRVEFWKNTYQMAFSGHSVKEVLEIVKENEILTWQTSCVPIKSPEDRLLLVCFSKDISLQTQRDVENSELIEKLNLAQKIGKIGYWEFDIDSEAIFWSDEVFQIWDIPVNSIQPNFDYFTSTFYPEDLPGFLVDHYAALDGIRPLDSIHRIKTEKGTTKYLREKGTITLSPNGRRRFTGTVQDITEERQTRMLLETKTKLISTTAHIVERLLESQDWNQ